MRKKLILLSFISAAVFSGPAYTEGLQETAEEPLALTISSLRGPSAIGLVKLIGEKPSYGSGVETEYQIAGSPDVLVSRLLSEEVDIATLPTNLAVKLYNKGVPYRFGAVTGYGLLYLLSRDPDINNIEDLAGGEVYNIGRGATPDFMFRYLLTEFGIDPKEDVIIRFTYGHPELAKMLIAGKVETGVLPEPFVTQVLTKNDQVRIAADLQQLWRQVQGEGAEAGADTTADPGSGTDGSSYPMTCVVINESLFEERPEVVENFMVSYRRSIEWVKANPEKAGELSESHGIGMPAAVASAAIPRLNLTFIPGTEAKELITQYLRVLLDFDPASIGGKLPDDRFYGGE